MNKALRQWKRYPSIIVVNRGFALNKSYVIIAIFLSLIAILIANISNAFLRGAPGGSDVYAGMSISLLPVGLTALAAGLLTTPVLLLYVYDKNNGVLEYFLSLGLNQGDIFKRYLKAAVILVVLLVFAVAVVNVAVALILRGDVIFALEASALAAALSFSVVSFSTTAMMAFSSLQKQRAGANQPLGLALGALLVMPVYISSFVLPFIVVVVVDLAETVVITALSIAMFLLASRLIRREKLLP